MGVGLPARGLLVLVLATALALGGCGESVGTTEKNCQNGGIRCAPHETCMPDGRCVAKMPGEVCQTDAECPAGPCVDGSCTTDTEDGGVDAGGGFADAGGTVADAGVDGGVATTDGGAGGVDGGAGECESGSSEICGSKVGVCRYGTRLCVGGVWGDCVGGVSPSPEICDGLDNDCNGQVDDREPACECLDGQSQSCGSSSVGECRIGSQTCVDGAWGTCVGSVEPAARQCDAKDRDCDGTPDHQQAPCECLSGEARTCGSPVGVCQEGIQSCVGGQWSGCAGSVDPTTTNSNEAAASLCNGLDDNCDGRVDEGCGCVPPAQRTCGSSVGECREGTEACQPNGTWGACTGNVAPATPQCDTLDRNCNGTADWLEPALGCECRNDTTRPCGTSLGVCSEGTQRCTGGRWQACQGAVGPTTTNPDEAAANLCNGLDDNCDGRTDEGCSCVPPAVISCGTSVGECREGTRTCQANGTFGPCEGAVGPGNPQCDEKDRNCNGLADWTEPATGCDCLNDSSRFCGTDVGICVQGTQTCVAGAWAACQGAVGPATANTTDESVDGLCNGLDDNCNNQVDEGCGCVGGMTRTCGSSVGECREGTETCQANGTWGACTGSVGAEDPQCDLKDRNCNGTPDHEDLGCTCINGTQRACGTNTGICTQGTETCASGVWGSCTGGTDPTTTETNEAVAGLCNGLDDNCDGNIDEGCSCAAGQTRPCSTDVGECTAGIQTCSSAGQWGACSGVEPAPRQCDAKDRDCDGTADYLQPPCQCENATTRSCGTDVGVCVAGTQECTAGAWGTCEGASGPTTTNMNESAVLLCNGLDDNCNGAIDEGCSCVSGATRSCGSDVGECVAGTEECQPNGTWGACMGAVGPATPECDLLDRNCNGVADHIDLGCTCVNDSTRPCGTNNGVCVAGTETCVAGSWGSCMGSTGPTTTETNEAVAGLCNGLDDNCDGEVDEGCACEEGATRACSTDVGECVAGTETCDQNGQWGPCSGVEPAPRQCDAKDRDCDGTLDYLQPPCECESGTSRNCGSDVGVCEFGTQMCTGGVWGSCGGGTGPTTANSNEADAQLCNGLDDNCDGQTDEGCDCVTDATRTCGTDVGECQSGTETCQLDGTWGACMGSTGPAAPQCDTLDRNCNGTADHIDLSCTCINGSTRSCGTDVGVCVAGTETCVSGSWGACQGSTGPSTTNPSEGAAALCNGLDDNCDGQVDEGCACITGQTRACSTDVGECTAGIETCNANGQWGACSGVGPTTRQCDDKDRDCDGVADYLQPPCECQNGTTQSCGSAVGVCELGSQTCVLGVWDTCAGGTGPTTTNSNEGTVGLCNGLDDNCDGQVDEGCGCVPPATQPCGTSDVGECQLGTQTCTAAGTWGTCEGNIEPTSRQCDALDRDCNGAPDYTQPPCKCLTGSTRPCGSDVGVCQAGAELCVDGRWSGNCEGGTGPTTTNNNEAAVALCNGLDDNCSGQVDEGCGCVPPATQPCGTTDVGECQLGSQSCTASGTWDTCVGNIEPTTRQCDMLDRDCDGIADYLQPPCECLNGSTQSCGTDVGVCVSGTQTCTGGVFGACTGATGPTTTNSDESAASLCNGLDDNCSGVADEGCGCVPPATQSCGTDVGECVSGTQACQADGTFGACEGGVGPQPRQCDMKDRDCDGIPDNQQPPCVCSDGETQACGSSVGACEPGVETCSGGSWGPCTGAVEPAPELCDGIDNDCDGAVDNGLQPPTAVPCWESSTGQLVCADPNSSTVAPLATVQLDGRSSSDPDSQPLSYSWRIASAPPGNNADITNPTSATPTLFAQLAGDYVICLTVTDTTGCQSSESCVTMHVVPNAEIHIQLVWDKDETDMDLHLMLDSIDNFLDDGNGPPGGNTRCNNALDCSFICKTPRWGPGGSEDDPRLDIDDIDGLGPENINLDAPFDQNPYVIAVHYWCDRPGPLYAEPNRGQSRATVRLFISGVLVRTWEKILRSGERWYVADLAWTNGNLPPYVVTDRGQVEASGFGCAQ